MTDKTVNGFLLTRGSSDRFNGTEIRLWASTDEGPALLRLRNHKPVFFISGGVADRARQLLKDVSSRIEIKPLELETFSSSPAAGVYCDTIQAGYRASDVLRDTGIDVFEADVRLHERFLMERFVRGAISFTGPAEARPGYLEYVDPRIRPTEYLPDLKSLSLDIECDTDSTLFSVGIAGCGIEEVIMIGSEQPFEEFSIFWVADERALLERLIARIQLLDPDIIIGWNLINFDLRILLARSRACGIKFAIGRNGDVPGWREIAGEAEKGFISIAGRVAIDGIDALKTATYRFPSFALESVSQELLGRGKLVEKNVHQRLEEIRQNFKHDKLALARYNLEDCRLVNEIFRHTQILDFLVLRSQLTGLELDRSGGAAAAFSNLYLPDLHRAGFVAPVPDLSSDEGSPGGYVMDSRPGIYNYVIVLDFKSLYPSIIRTFKIDPMGMILGMQNLESAIPGFRGAAFHRDRHFLPGIISELWQQRDIAKANGDGVRSQAIKILMNSFYGILGASNCRFYDPRLTSSITMRGHRIIQTTAEWLEKDGHEVIYGDTDSIFLWIPDARSRADAESAGRSLERELNERWRDAIAREFNLESYLELEFETCFSRFLMPTVRGSDSGSKKRYAGLVVSESDGGEAREKLVFKGLENVRTDWTDLAREFQLTLYDMVFHDRDPVAFIRETVEETRRGNKDEKLIYRKQLRRPLAKYVKNVPPHVRAARLADEKNRSLGRPETYQHKGWISYAVTLNGPEAAEYLESPLDYDHYIEKQIKPVADGILPFIDLDFDTITSAQAQIF